MIKKIKASRSEKFIFIFLILLGIATFCTYYIVKNKCLFVKNIDPKEYYLLRSHIILQF